MQGCPGSTEPSPKLYEPAHTFVVASKVCDLTTKAVDTIEPALDSGDSKVAVEVLKAVGLYGHVEPPRGPTEPDLVLWQQAGEWASQELLKKGPSTNPVLDILTHDADLAKLTRQRMDELRQGWSNG